MLLHMNRIRSFASLACVALFAGCAHKEILKPKADFLQSGTYRSQVETAPGAVPGAATGMSLQLNGNGRFSLATQEGNCVTAEDRGTWSSTQAELTLRVQKTLRRASCASAWQEERKDTAFYCAMRNVTDRSFRMLHDEIRQGTEWTAWEREGAQGFAAQERPGMEPEAEAVTLKR
jgi:hypothetical protein